MRNLEFTRRDVIRSSVGLAGITLPTFFQARAKATTSRRAKSCIVIYLWGGISHYESWDPKPEAPSDLRGEFASIPTSVPGIRFCEHLPLMARHADKLAIVRSVTHKDGAHSSALYQNMTGQKAPQGRAKDRNNWPSLAAMVSRFRRPQASVPAAVRMPYSMYDNGTLIQGQFGGWLGAEYDPVLIPTPAGRPFGGTSRTSGRELDLKLNLKAQRLQARRQLLEQLERPRDGQPAYDQLDQFQKMAADMLIDSAISEAYDLEAEDTSIRELYGQHVGGQGLLLARRLIEVGVPIVQVCAGAGDLAGGSGDNWDTHRHHFPKMKDRLLPVLDRSVFALLTDLELRGMLEETLVVFLTDFGRTPKINKNGGRDHHPGVYSVAFAGAGIQGGQVYGSSDSSGSAPGENPCSPADLHATVYKALGIDPRAELHDMFGRPYSICDGDPLPIS